MFLQAFAALTFQNAEHSKLVAEKFQSSTGSNDHAFLRAPNGAHLGPVSQAARQPRSGTGSHAEWFSAQVESQRFAEARELVATWQPQQIRGEHRKTHWWKMGKHWDFIHKISSWNWFNNHSCLDVFGHMFFVDGFEFECYLHWLSYGVPFATISGFFSNMLTAKVRKVGDPGVRGWRAVKMPGFPIGCAMGCRFYLLESQHC